MDRWARQISLREVGEAGQARIAAARLVVPADQPLTAELLVRAGAGVQVTPAPGPSAAGTPAGGAPPGSAPDQPPAEPFRHAPQFHHDAPRAMAAQAAAALAHLRRVLGVSA